MSGYDLKILFGILGEFAIALLVVAVVCFCGAAVVEKVSSVAKAPAIARPSDPARPPGDPDDYILVQTVEGGFVWMKIR